jgi:hypothetical protein
VVGVLVVIAVASSLLAGIDPGVCRARSSYAGGENVSTSGF